VFIGLPAMHEHGPVTNQCRLSGVNWKSCAHP
jgi:hypothetical protein